MPENDVVQRDIDREVDDLLQQLDSVDIDIWLADHEHTASGTQPRRMAAEFIASARQIMSQAEMYMDAASAPGYEVAPVVVKRVIESLFDPNMRERIFELIMADSEQYRKREERKYGQTYMQHIAGPTTR